MASRFDLERARRHWKARDLARRQAGRERAERLLALLPRARRCLVDDYGVRRVVLFGSLVTGSPSPDSDVDLAVEGLETALYFDAVADLTEILGGEVDLVRLEEADASIRAAIETDGRTL